jgi:hypothetical protein
MERAYEQLIDDLKRACAEENPLDGRVLAVMAARDFMTALKVPASLTQLLNDATSALIDLQMLHEHGNKPGPKPKPFDERTKAGIAAAMVTALRACNWRVDDAIRAVCKETRLDRKWLRQLRDNLHRGIGDPLTLGQYFDCLEDFQELAPDRLEDEVLLQLKALARS